MTTLTEAHAIIDAIHERVASHTTLTTNERDEALRQIDGAARAFHQDMTAAMDAFMERMVGLRAHVAASYNAQLEADAALVGSPAPEPMLQAAE